MNNSAHRHKEELYQLCGVQKPNWGRQSAGVRGTIRKQEGVAWKENAMSETNSIFWT